MHTLPIARALLYGVVKSFVRLILDKVPAHTQRPHCVLQPKQRHVLVMSASHRRWSVL